ncbi:hypothetical protein BaRGS_00004711 [Batillaria attramentaria]|uniref:Uncharacterized protein n=1 Tax=Batillaria attramentaria TaxID=370345 RepID=A0ABD0LY69_9CAEN
MYFVKVAVYEQAGLSRVESGLRLISDEKNIFDLQVFMPAYLSLHTSFSLNPSVPALPPTHPLRRLCTKLSYTDHGLCRRVWAVCHKWGQGPGPM